MKSDVDRVKDALCPRAVPATRPHRLLSTGSTLLNLALSGAWQGGLPRGEYLLLVGDSQAGKTWLALTCLAEAAIGQFKNYRLVYDGPEGGALMDIGKYFGEGVASRLEYRSSGLLEDFYFSMDDLADDGKPHIVILDSMDALVAREEKQKFAKTKKARRAGEETTGTMTDGKAKANSSGMRRVLNRLRETNSILILICQAKMALGMGAQFEPKTRAGGTALKYYAAAEVWLSIRKRMAKEVAGRRRRVGIILKATVKKNRITGREPSVDVPLYYSYGIDDVGSMIDWLLLERRVKRQKGRMTLLEMTGTREELAGRIIDEGKENDLRALVGKHWKEIDDACALKRRPRYQ